MNVRGWTLAVIFAASITCCAQSDSLGDVAREQKAAPHAKAKRVVTDENLPHASPSEAMNGAVVVPGAPAPQDEVSAAEGKAQAVKDASAQPATPADAQKKLDDLKATQEAQQRAVKKFEEELKDDSISSERRQLFEEGLNNARQLLAQATHERESIEQAVTPADAKSGETKSTDDKSVPVNSADEKSAEAKATEDKPQDKSAEPKTEGRKDQDTGEQKD